MKTANKFNGLMPRSVFTGAALCLALSVNAAEPLVNPETTQPLGSFVPLVLSNGDLSVGNVKGYRAWFENGSWQGDIGEYNVSKTGALSTTLDYTGATPINTDGSASANWSAILKYAENEAADSDYWRNGRKIITYSDGGQVPFKWSEIDCAYKKAIDPFAATDSGTCSGAAAESLILNHIRGDRSNEFPNGGENNLRDRISVLGDVVHNTPRYVGPPNAAIIENGYPTWATNLKDREPRLYVGANDGMLHVYDVEDGNEVYAYVPSMLQGTLANIANLPYQHTYFVDGHLSVADAYFNNSGTTTTGSPEWHTVLVGTLGAGGKGIFALDITDPDLDNTNNPGANDTKAMWEYSAAGDDDLGYTYAKGVIARLNDDNYYLVIGNGYSSANGEAVLYIINIATGAVVKKISTGTGSSASPNGLSSPVLLDYDRDGRVDAAFAGDIDGDLWKFDLLTANTSNWRVAYGGTPLYNGATTQPITTAPTIALHPNNGYLIYFATGKLLSEDDLENDDVQGLFAVHDDGATPPNTPQFVTQPYQIKVFPVAEEESEDIGIYEPDKGSTIDWTDNNVLGWKILFGAGERILRPLQIRGNRVKGVVANPTGEFGDNWMVEAALWDGGPHTKPIFDLNRDGSRNNADLYNAGGGDEDDDFRIPMLWRQAKGVMSEVTIARVADGVDTLFLNYLVPPYDDEPECFEDCEGGLKGGHIDVDTWHGDVEYGGVVSQHDHEYDKQVGNVIVDFFNLNIKAGDEPLPRKDVSGQINIDVDPGDPVEEQSGIPSDERLILLIANADFSSGATLTVGDHEWNAFEYQLAIHTALKNWNPGDPTSRLEYDRDGDGGEPPVSLIMTWGDIKAAGGTIKFSLGDRAILDGGLHPTQPYCLTRSAFGAEDGNPTTLVEFNGEYVGRWRNGALVTQLIPVSHFEGASSGIERVRIQYPLDLQTTVNVKGVGPLASRVDFNDNGTIERENQEFIGGLLAASGDELLWEGVLFWHFGSLYEAIHGSKPCYGSPKWAEATALEQSNDPLAAALDQVDDLGFVDEDGESFDFSEDSIEEALDQVLDCIRAQGDQLPTTDGKLPGVSPRDRTECQALALLLIKIQDIIEHYEIEYTPPGPDDTPQEYDGVEGIGNENDVVNPTDTDHTNFQFGRKSWTDVP